MTVTENANGTFLIVVTPEERAAFDEALASGVFTDGTAALALQGFLSTAFTTLQRQIRQALIDRIHSRLPGQTTQLLRTVLGGLT